MLGASLAPSEQKPTYKLLMGKMMRSAYVHYSTQYADGTIVSMDAGFLISGFIGIGSVRKVSCVRSSYPG